MPHPVRHRFGRRELQTLYWLQCGGCGGDTMSLLGAESPGIADLTGPLSIDPLWHPSFSNVSPAEHRALEDRLTGGQLPLDILVVEGSVILGPDGSGLFDTRDGRPKKDVVAALCGVARTVVAAGTCAAFGGFGAGSETQASGLQFRRAQRGGLLPADFVAGSGQPVINLAGCPVHHTVLACTLAALAAGSPIELDEFNRPLEWYGLMVHQGCTRNEYHEYRVEEDELATRGCLFFHRGCHGPLVGGPCNKALWNGRSSKTRVGVPCFGCTSPAFPPDYPFFATRNIEGIPLDLPRGVSRAHYMAYKGMAAAAAPERLKKRQTRI